MIEARSGTLELEVWMEGVKNGGIYEIRRAVCPVKHNVRVCVYLFVYMYIYTHTHTHTHIYIYIYIYIFVDRVAQSV